MDPPTEIRLASPRDAEQIAAVLRAAFREFRPQYTPEAYRATTPTAQEIISRFAEGPIWIAEIGAAAVATVSTVARLEEVHVRSMAVLRTARGRSIGKRLLEVVDAFAVDRRSHRITLMTTPFLKSAIDLYERVGFRRSGIVSDLHGTSLFGMVKCLDDDAGSRR
jgi:GNAT superfamily N-acetyltransferase